MPDYSLPYFDTLCGEYRSLPPDQVKPEVKALLDEIMAKRTHDGALRWPDLYTFDALLAHLQPPEKLPRLAWSLRSRYRDVAGLSEYDAYLASKPPELSPTPAEAELRADIDFLLGQIHLRYAMTPVREGIRDWLSRAVAWITLAGLIVIIAFTFLVSSVSTNGSVHLLGLSILLRDSTLIVVLFVGALGGLMSMQQRFQSISDEGDPIDNVSGLASGWLGIFLAALSGAIFAAVLYFVLAAGLLAGELFPTITSAELPSITVDPQHRFIEFIRTTGPAAGVDYAKLLIWSFLAGFAERLVPDTLSRFIERRGADGGTTT